MDAHVKLAVLMEEVGEVARALIEKEPVDDLRAELIQVAAVAHAWAESLTEIPTP
jgi:NTP pyrophosphatase (non-canonical NTP hydrolase)